MGCPTHHWIYGENIHSEKLPTYSQTVVDGKGNDDDDDGGGDGNDVEPHALANRLENCLR